MPSVFMINVYVGNERRQDWTQGKIGLWCSHKTSADPVGIATGMALQSCPHLGWEKALFTCNIYECLDTNYLGRERDFGK